MKKVLVIHYSQSGQLTDITRNFSEPLVNSNQVDVTFELLKPVDPYPFPWPFITFFDTFPESVYLDPPPIEPCPIPDDEHFDLVILAYQVWFLSPSGPVTAFLKSSAGRRLLHDTPVVTLIGCRNMWLMAQEKVKGLLEQAGARLVGNVALVDEAGGAMSFFATPAWVLTGNKGPRWGGLIPRAGVAEAEIRDTRRFGERILHHLSEDRQIDEQLLQGLGAVNVNERYILSEKTAHRGFRIWGKWLRSVGPSGHPGRKPILLLYATFLIIFICTFIPITVLIKALISPLTRKHIREQKAYFEQPSGSEWVKLP